MTLNISFDEDKLRELVEEAVKRLIEEGYIWREQEDEVEE